MHLEILVEDSSGRELLELIVPRIIGAQGFPHSWRTHCYRGIGRIPGDCRQSPDPAKRMLLNCLPRILEGYARTPGIDGVVVVVDTDRRDCRAFLDELQAIRPVRRHGPRIVFRLAIEEVEAWYLGDRKALRKAFPEMKARALSRYEQDSACGTWEMVADAIYPGGRAAIRRAGWPLPGQVKHEWARRIGPHLDVENNASPSFRKFRDGLRTLVHG